MGTLIIRIIGFIIAAIGVILIYDARDLSQKLFSNSDKNTSAKSLRILGFIIAIIGAIIVYIAKYN